MPFRKHKIVRTCTVKFKKHGSYKSYLSEDFSHRCGYCNMKDDRITTFFEVDHYIPRKYFKGKRDELSTNYNNLIYSCRKCNLAKSSSFKGDVYKDPLKNELIYDPALVDFNDIFYRNQYGGISSNDEVGKNMINIIKLYLPIHNLAWICEELDEIIDIIEEMILTKNYPCDVMELLEEACGLLSREYHKKERVFTRNYNIG